VLVRFPSAIRILHLFFNIFVLELHLRLSNSCSNAFQISRSNEMAMRMIARRLVNPSGEVLLARSFARREMSSGNGRMLHDEEKAAETIYIKKMEKEKLEKLARKGFSEEEAKKAVEGHPEAHPEAVKILNESASSSTNTSTDSTSNYAVIGGIIGVLAIGYWYFSGSSKKEDENKE